MQISYKWLSEYIDHQQSPETIAHILTNTGLEVEETSTYSNLPPFLEDLVIGHVDKVQPHPDADKLKLTQVSTNKGEPAQIICGAPNVAEGQKVVVAPVGTTIQNQKGEQLKIKRSKIRGVKSEGMIVSEHEIGLGDDQSGIIVMDDRAQIGESVLEHFSSYEDHVFEIGLTPNRSDATSHVGVARDLSAYLNKNIVYPDVSDFEGSQNQEDVSIQIQAPAKCPRYSGLVIRDIQVTESPDWLKNRLKAVGVQPINNIVDITNYVMMEWGHPLHAFDLDKMEGNEIFVQSAPKGQDFTTLDGETRTLEGTELMICDAQRPIAMAGIMGGLASCIDQETNAIFLESAYFEPVAIRRAAKRHQLMTDASFRFERGADPEITVDALKRASLLIQEIAGGTIATDIMDEYPKPQEPAKVNLEYNYLDTLLGQALPREQIQTILRRLGFKIEKATSKGLNLQVPTYRVDVTRPVDVAEEVIRIHSLDAIEVSYTLTANLAYDNDLSDQKLRDKLAGLLTGNGFLETINQPFTSEKEAEKFPALAGENTVQLINPLSQDQNRLRKSPLITGLATLQYNINRDNPNLRLFEFGRVYWEEGAKIYEGDRLSLFMTGDYHSPSWYQEAQSVDFYYLKALVQNLLSVSGIQDWEIAEEDRDEFAYNLAYYVKDKCLVDFGSVKPAILKPFDIEQEVLYANFDFNLLTTVSRTHRTHYHPISKYPAVDRDLSIKIPESVQFKSIKDLIHQLETRYLKAMKLFDVYQGEHIETGYKSYAFRLVFQDEEKTLKDKEVDKIMKPIMERLEKDLGAEIRK